MKKWMVYEKEDELLGELFQANDLRELRLSYSRISAFAKGGPRAIINRPDLTGDGISLGKLTDVLLFTPDEVEKEFVIFDGEKPTAQSGTLADIILLNYDKMPPESTLLNLVKHNNLWTNIKDEEKIKAKWEEDNFQSYVENMFRAKGKTLITNAMYHQALELVSTLKSHKHSKHIFRESHKHEDFYDQYAIEFRYKNFMVRGILDRLIINHIDKTIQMIDLKTGAPHGLQFMKSFMDYRYFIQAAVYTLGVDYIREQLGLDEEYELLPFQFVYIGGTDKVPYVYTMSDAWSKAALNGFTTKSGYKYAGLNELIDDITWHWDKQLFDLPREVYESEGLLTLKDDFIIANE